MKIPATHSRPRGSARSRIPNSSWPLVLTIGHSTRAIEDFIHLLQVHEVTRVVDVRTVPRSRHNPQFNRETLAESLKAAGIGYDHLPELGGLRRPRPDSPNMGWRNTSFRGYADYMQTREFATAIDRLLKIAQHDRIALMCAEAVPWRCHRSLVADALLVRRVRTEDIMSATRRQVHVLTPFARVRGTRITYPATAETAPTADAGERPRPAVTGGRKAKLAPAPLA